MTDVRLTGTVRIVQRGSVSPQELPDAEVKVLNIEKQMSLWQKTGPNGEYTLTLPAEIGIWRLAVEKDGIGPAEPRSIQVTGQETAPIVEDWLVKPVVRAGGTVYWRATNERVKGAVIQANDGESPPIYATANDDGDFILPYLHPGTWTLTVLHAQSLPCDPEQVDLGQNKTDFRFELNPVLDRDSPAGRRFFYYLIAGLIALVAVFLLLHALVGATYQPLSTELDARLTGLILEARQPTTATLSALTTRVEQAGKDAVQAAQGLSETVKSVIQAQVNLVKGAKEASALAAALEDLQRSLRLPGPYFWTSEPWRYVELMLWALAGVLVGKIILTGWWLYRRKFYRQGIVMHISQIVAMPLLVLVTVLLISQIKFELTLSGGSSLVLDLSNPGMMVALAFLLGTVPWPIWNFVRGTAEQVTEQISVKMGPKTP